MKKHAKKSSVPRCCRLPLAFLGSLDAIGRIGALVHLVSKSRQPRRSKVIWALALTFINSLGLLPLAYYKKFIR